TIRQEDWRHTSVAAIARMTFRRPRPDDTRADLAVLSELTFGRVFEGHQLVFVNGRYARELSSVQMADGVQVRSLREVLDREPQLLQPWLDGQAPGPGRAFAALNSAFLDDGAFVMVPPGTVLAAPIHL